MPTFKLEQINQFIFWPDNQCLTRGEIEEEKQKTVFFDIGKCHDRFKHFQSYILTSHEDYIMTH